MEKHAQRHFLNADLRETVDVFCNVFFSVPELCLKLHVKVFGRQKDQCLRLIVFSHILGKFAQKIIESSCYRIDPELVDSIDNDFGIKCLGRENNGDLFLKFFKESFLLRALVCLAVK